MPNVTAFQRADRLALLVAIDSFFGLVGKTAECRKTQPGWPSRSGVASTRASPPTSRSLMSFLGWSKTKVLTHLKELEEVGFEFRTVKDPLDNRRSVQRLHGIETRRRPSSSTSA